MRKRTSSSVTVHLKVRSTQPALRSRSDLNFACIVTGVHDLDAYLHAQLLLAVRTVMVQPLVLLADIDFWTQALTLALPLLAPGATLIFKIFLSPSDPTGEILISQLEPFFSFPQDGDELIDDTLGNPYDEGGCEVKGYDRYGRRGGVWVRKPRSSRAGSAGE